MDGRTVLFLAAAVPCWYATNAAFSISLKRSFSTFPDVLALTTLQLGLIALLGVCALACGALPWRQPASVWRLLLPSGALFLGGTLATNISLTLLPVGVSEPGAPREGRSQCLSGGERLPLHIVPAASRRSAVRNLLLRLACSAAILKY